MSGYWYAPDDHEYAQSLMNGSAHSVSSEPLETDNAQKVREIAEEVTGKQFPTKSRSIGFLNG